MTFADDGARAGERDGNLPPAARAAAFTGLREEDVEDLSRVGRDTGLMLGGSGFGRFLGLVFNFLAARVVGEAIFGLYILGSAVINYLVVLANFGLDQALVRFVAIHRGAKDMARLKGVLVQGLAVNLALSLAGGAGLFLLGPWAAASLFHKPELGPVLRWMAWTVPAFTLINCVLGATQGYRRMKYTPFIRDLLHPVLKLTVVVALFVFGARLYALLTAHVAAALIAAVACLFLLARTFAPLVARHRPVYEPAMLRFGFPLFLNDVVMKTFRWSDVIFLGFFRGSGEIGIYKIAQITSEISRIIYQAFKTTFSPVISLLHHQGDKEALRHRYIIASKWAFAASFPPLVFFSLLARESLGVFGGRFASGALCLVILNAGRMVSVSTGLSANLIVMSGHARWTLFNSVLGNALNFLLNALFISRWGILGAAWAMAVSVSLLNLVQMFEARYLFGFYPWYPGYLKPLAASLLAGVAAKYLVVLLALPPLAGLAVAAPVFLGLYLAGLFAFGLPPEDRLLLRQFKERIPWLRKH